MDYSQYSDEELEKIAAGEDVPLISSSKGILSKLGHGYMNYAGGALRGIGQTIGDIGASALNYPIGALENKLGHPLPHVPHPNLLHPNPNSLAESVGQSIGQLGAGIGIPLGFSTRIASILSKASPVAKTLAGASAGGIEGYLGNENNREIGASLGSILGTAGAGVPELLKYGKSFRSQSIAKDVAGRMENLKSDFGNKFNKLIENAADEIPNKNLKPVLVNRDLYKEGGYTKYLHALDKFNIKPDLQNAHKAQAELNKVANKSFHKEGDLYKDIALDAKKAKENILNQIQNALEKTSNPEYANEFKNLRQSYAKDLGPYLNSKAITSYKKGNLAPRYVANKLLGEEETLSKIGKFHPKLRQREILMNLMQSGLLSKLGAAGLGAMGLYNIGKLIP